MNEEEYFIEGEFTFRSFLPGKLEKGMRFLKISHPSGEVEFTFFTLTEDITEIADYMLINGAPMDVNISVLDDDTDIIATSEQIGYFDNGEFLKEISDVEVNEIINAHEGVMLIKVNEEGEPILHKGKVIISYISSPETGKD